MRAGTPLQMLAIKLGLMPAWQDINGQDRQVAPETLRQVICSFGITCTSDRQIATALKDQEAVTPVPTLITATAGDRLSIPGNWGQAKPGIRLEGEDRAQSCEAAISRRSLDIVAPKRPGYHQLDLGEHQITLAVCPKRAVSTSQLTKGRRSWGLAAQLYSLRGAETEGAGDFIALHHLVGQAAKAGAAALAISPVHAQFAADPHHFSPYSPSSRLWLNVLHINVAAAYGTLLPDVRIPSPGRADRRRFIDWPALSDWKHQHLAKLFRVLNDTGRLAAGQLTGDAFQRFVTGGGDALLQHALFETLHAYFLAQPGGQWQWRNWPPPYQTPDSPACRRFRQEQKDQVAFHLFLQFLARQQLQAAAVSARQQMGIGLVSDIAVGIDGGGSQAWSQRQTMLTGLSIGAPPDAFNLSGQNWGITTFSPRSLRAHGYRPFIDLIRASLGYAGGVRLDHVLGLSRLWVIPSGAAATEGVYLRYPVEDLLRLAALESHRHRAFILGEDLGTVPDGFRDDLQRKGIAGMEVLWFQRDGDAFRAQEAWSRHAVGMTTTHDLPTISGWWKGTDLGWRRKLAKPPVAEDRAARAQRGVDRAALWQQIKPGRTSKVPKPSEATSVVDAAVRFLAGTPCDLVILPLEDAVATSEQPNLPGTIDEHPNWRRRFQQTTQEMFRDPALRRRLRQLRRERPR